MLTTSFTNCWKTKKKLLQRESRNVTIDIVILKFLTFITMVSSPFFSFITNTFKRFILTMSILTSWQGNTRITLNSFPANFASTMVWCDTIPMDASLIVSKITNRYGAKFFNSWPSLMTYYLTRIIASICFTFL